jgi:capsule polysaccharide export protein KpsE/RkpR
MANFVIRRMNERIVDLNTGRSKDNREFLGKRVDDIRADLAAAEDSLRIYQERTGLLDAKTQLQGIITANTTLETELEAKQLQEGVMERLYDRESPQVKELQIQIDVYQKKLSQMRTQNDPGSPLLPLKQLPQTTVEFLRRYRAVELDNLLLQYILPLYEQAKIEEMRDYPVLQIIDAAIPPAKKSYPPRTLFSLIGAFSVTLFVVVILRVRRYFADTTDPRWRTILGDVRHWTWRRRGTGG